MVGGIAIRVCHVVEEPLMCSQRIACSVGAVLLAICVGLLSRPSRGDQTSAPAAERVEELIELLKSNQPDSRQDAQDELVAIGEPAAPALWALVEEGGRQSVFEAQCALKLMGPKARPILPRLLELAKAKPVTQPASAPATPSPRLSALSSLRNMSWAADEAVPVLTAVAEDEQEEDRVRTAALSALGGMGRGGTPVLQRLASGPQSEFRERARSILAQALQEQGTKTRAEYYAELVEADMFGDQTPDYLVRVMGGGLATRADPLTTKVKAAYRARLKEQPDARLALALAKIIQNQLAATEIEWAAPSDSSSGRRPRLDPHENYSTMAEIMALGFKHAEKGSDSWRTLGVGLAKIRLLQGDWAGMNQMLVQLGQQPVPDERRPLLPAPPVNWAENLAGEWKECDESMRSGQCALVLSVEKGAEKLRGVHVLIKEYRAQPEEARRYATGVRADTLFLNTLPVESFFGRATFGYQAQDRGKTRYAIPDEQGGIRIDRLPEVPVKIEVLVPTSSFAEAGRSWDMWMEVEPGRRLRAAVFGADAVKHNEPPAVVELKAGQTVRYPRLMVLPQLYFDIDDWTAVDPGEFILTWSDLRSAVQGEISYEMTMTVSGPDKSAHSATFAPDVGQAGEITKANRWEVGAKGVGGMKLRPGNIYVFQVRAVDGSGLCVGESGKTRVWVPWTHRTSDPPYKDHDTYRQPPVDMSLWFRGEFSYGDGRHEDLKEKVDRHLRDYPGAFEYEYLEVVKAWLDWHDGKIEAARDRLKPLVDKLPEGNVARETAGWLLAHAKPGEEPPKRLEFGIPETQLPAAPERN